MVIDYICIGGEMPKKEIKVSCKHKWIRFTRYKGKSKPVACCNAILYNELMPICCKSHCPLVKEKEVNAKCNLKRSNKGICYCDFKYDNDHTKKPTICCPSNCTVFK